MTCANTVGAVEVTSPDLRGCFVSFDPIDVADSHYPWAAGWTVRIVHGRHTPHGFQVVSAGQGGA